MKKYTFTLLLVLMTLSLMAQKRTRSNAERDDDKRWHELELNTVFLLQEVFGTEDPEDILNGYLIGYKTGKANVGLRFALGAGFDLRNEQESILDKQGLRQYHFRARLGIEWRKKIVERWYLISGLDLIGATEFREDITTSSFDEISSSESKLSIGGGPLLGVRFWINPNISLATETAIHGSYVQTVETIDSQNLPDFDSKKVSFSYPISFAPPVNLYLIIRF